MPTTSNSSPESQPTSPTSGPRLSRARHDKQVHTVLQATVASLSTVKSALESVEDVYRTELNRIPEPDEDSPRAVDYQARVTTVQSIRLRLMELSAEIEDLSNS